MIEQEKRIQDTVLRISPTRKTFIVEVHRPGGIVTYKEISPMDVYLALNGSYYSQVALSSGFLPDNCLHVSISSTEKQFVLWNPELRADVTYQNVEYLNFPIPRLVFGIRMMDNGRVVECSIGVVADEKPTPETAMYHYPFSNVHPDGKVCTGNNVMPRYRKLSALKHFPRYLLGLPDNDDMFSSENNRLGLGHRELLEHLKEKDPSYYYSDVLVPSGKTLQEFISRR